MGVTRLRFVVALVAVVVIAVVVSVIVTVAVVVSLVVVAVVSIVSGIAPIRATDPHFSVGNFVVAADVGFSSLAAIVEGHGPVTGNPISLGNAFVVAAVRSALVVVSVAAVAHAGLRVVMIVV